MKVFDPTTARCHVFAWKEGLLSAVGHDVKLQVRTFRVEVDDDRVTGVFDPKSLATVCAVRQGHDDFAALSEKDRVTIDGYVQKDILDTRRHAEIRFASTAVDLADGEGEVTGTLTLHGRSRTITARVTRESGRTVARVRLSQPDFGITPFKAMLGTLRIQPQVDVELSLPELAPVHGG